METVAAARPANLPSAAQPYREIGPFDASTLPAGLLQTHYLKEGVWGLVRLEAGRIDFVWEEGDRARVILAAPAQIVVPPGVPHHLEADGDFSLSIVFHRA